MKDVVVKVIFNDEVSKPYDYKYFEVMLASNKIERFNYHKSNPIPTEAEILGLTWDEVIELCKKKWYEAIENYKKER